MMTRWQIEEERDKRAQEEWRARQQRLAMPTATKPSSTLVDARYEATLSVDFEDDGDGDRDIG
jgi:hypothetical protein